MGVYVKGMEIPKYGCRDCIFVNFKWYGDVCPILKKEVTENIARCGFHPNCPLVEVPSHGRLIDADVLPTDIEWEDILDAPTVIEADVSEEELQREYEANVEYAQYCERYEPTYDPNTGAM